MSTLQELHQSIQTCAWFLAADQVWVPPDVALYFLSTSTSIPSLYQLGKETQHYLVAHSDPQFEDQKNAVINIMYKMKLPFQHQREVGRGTAT